MAHAEILAALVLQALVELDPVAGQIGLELARPVADEARAGPGRLGAQRRFALQQHNESRARLGEMQRGPGAHDPATGDDDVGCGAHQSATAPSAWK